MEGEVAEGPGQRRGRRIGSRAPRAEFDFPSHDSEVAARSCAAPPPYCALVAIDRAAFLGGRAQQADALARAAFPLSGFCKVVIE